ncbi:MAG: patatin-like phospholipase family protein, partial [Desulfobacterales bacterium]|nr:patatin-like phospholipase family protein [Desulfobacterales bacterium]
KKTIKFSGMEFELIIPKHHGRIIKDVPGMPDQTVDICVNNDKNIVTRGEIRSEKLVINMPREHWGIFRKVIVKATDETSLSLAVAMMVKPEIKPFQGPMTVEPNKSKSVLSISIGDMSAMRVLNHLIEEKAENYDIFTGSGFGGIIALLLALDIPPKMIKEYLLKKGKYIAKEGITKPFRVMAKVTDPRNSFAHLDRFICDICPDVQHLKVRDLSADIFFPISNITGDIDGNICKNECPDLPILSAARCICATFQDWEHLELKEKNTQLKGPFSTPGTIWNALSVGHICPDLQLAEVYGYKNLKFKTFVCKIKPSEITNKKISKHFKYPPHVKASEMNCYRQAKTVTSALEAMEEISYHYRALPEVVWNAKFTEADIENALKTRPRTVIRF